MALSNLYQKINNRLKLNQIRLFYFLKETTASDLPLKKDWLDLIPRVISLSLCGDATDNRLERFAPIKNIPQDEIFLFCDEADVGAHTLRSAKVLNYVFPMGVV